MKTYIQEQEELSRPLTQDELETAVQAMRFLYKKGISPGKIEALTTNRILPEQKIRFIYNTKHFKFIREICFKGTPLEKQIENLPKLKSRIRIFPKKVWTKRKNWGFGIPYFSEAEIAELLGLKPKKVKKEPLLKKQKDKIVIRVAF